jgi:hypothetical protein
MTSDTQKPSESTNDSFHIPTKEEYEKMHKGKNIEVNNTTEGSSGVLSEEKIEKHIETGSSSGIPPEERDEKIIETGSSSGIPPEEKPRGNSCGEKNIEIKDSSSVETVPSKGKPNPEEPLSIKSCPFESRFLNLLKKSKLPEKVKNAEMNIYESKATIINQVSECDVRDKFHNEYLIRKFTNTERIYNSYVNELIHNNNKELVFTYTFNTPAKSISIEEAKVEIGSHNPVSNAILQSIIEQSLLKGFLLTNDVFSDLEVDNGFKGLWYNIQWNVKRTLTFAKKE